VSHDDHWRSVEDTVAVFPNFKAELLGVFAEGDRVFQYWFYSGTHRAPTSDRAPTGSRVEWRALSDSFFEACGFKVHHGDAASTLLPQIGPCRGEVTRTESLTACLGPSSVSCDASMRIR